MNKLQMSRIASVLAIYGVTLTAVFVGTAFSPEEQQSIAAVAQLHDDARGHLGASAFPDARQALADVQAEPATELATF